MSKWKIQAKYFDPETREWQEDTFIRYRSSSEAIDAVELSIREIGGKRILIKSCVEIND